MSAFGGTLGVWTGLSLLSILQFFELFVNFTISCFRQQREGNKDKDEKLGNPDSELQKDNLESEGVEEAASDGTERDTASAKSRISTVSDLCEDELYDSDTLEVLPGVVA